jgi:hypothetical protein
VKEKLLARGEHKIRTAVDAIQYSVLVVHDRLPRGGKRNRNRPCLALPAGPASLSSYVFPQQGPGPQKPCGKCVVTSPCRGERKNCCAPARAEHRFD